MNDKNSNNSLFRIFALITLSVFVCETIVMMILSSFTVSSYFMRIIIDSTLLIILLFPLLHAILFRPLIRNSENLKQANEKLRASEKKYRVLFEASMDSIYITTREGDIIDANQSHLDLFGYSREEISEGKAQDTYVNPDERSRFKKEMEENGS
ncbi:MAG: PAS domain S-box protein, partial [Desulfobacterales bacterium]